MWRLGNSTIETVARASECAGIRHIVRLSFQRAGAVVTQAPNTKEHEGDVDAENSSSDGWSAAFFCWGTPAQVGAPGMRVRRADGGCACEFASGRSRRSLWRRNWTYRRRTSGSNRRRRGRCRVGTPVLGTAKQSALLLDRQFLLPALPVLQWTVALLLSDWMLSDYIVER